MARPAPGRAGSFIGSNRLIGPRLPRLGRDGDLDRLAAVAGEAGEHRLDQARHHLLQIIGPRAGLGAALEQRGIVGLAPDLHVELADIIIVSADAVIGRTVPEGVVPAPQEGAAATAIIRIAPTAPVEAVGTTIAIA